MTRTLHAPRAAARRRWGIHRPGRGHPLGQSLVEFSLTLPVMILVVLMAVDFGRAFLGWVSLTNAARIGANYAGLHPDANWSSSTDPDRVKYNALITNDLSGTNCPVGSLPKPVFSPDTSLGSDASVSLSCQFRFLTPGIAALLGNQITISSTAVFPVRSGQYGSGSAPTPAPTPTSTPTPPPTATPTPTPTPAPCSAPNFINHRKNDAQAMWNSEGFTTTVQYGNGVGNFKIGYQSVIAGQPYSCTGTTVLVAENAP